MIWYFLKKTPGKMLSYIPGFPPLRYQLLVSVSREALGEKWRQNSWGLLWLAMEPRAEEPAGWHSTTWTIYPIKERQGTLSTSSIFVTSFPFSLWGQEPLTTCPSCKCHHQREMRPTRTLTFPCCTHALQLVQEQTQIWSNSCWDNTTSPIHRFSASDPWRN